MKSLPYILFEKCIYILALETGTSTVPIVSANFRSLLSQIYRTDLCRIFRLGRTVAVDDQSEMTISIRRSTLPRQPYVPAGFIRATDCRHASGRWRSRAG